MALRIKDNVDLKELEKFGFKYNDVYNYYYFNIDISERLEIDKLSHEIHLFIDDEYYHCRTGNNTFDLLYDLIKADLVEKVEVK